MWTFFDFGLLMPAMVDDDLKKRADWASASHNGQFDFQVRFRIKDHGKYFRENFMTPGTYGDIISTPDHDYNFRFYTTKLAYAEGMKQAVLAIDYRKFKPSSERYKHGKKYHQVLNSVWADVCSLNTPGDIWGPYSVDNPKGYRSVWEDDRDSWYDEQPGRRIGDSFANIQFEEDENDTEWQEIKLRRILKDMDKYNIPMKDWWEFTSRSEFEALTVELSKHFGPNTIEKMRKKNAKNVASWAAEGVVL